MTECYTLAPMRTHLLFAFVLLGCGKSNPVTPEKTTLVEWDTSKSTRADFRAATIGARTSKDVKVTVKSGDAPFVVDVHVETAPVDYSEGSHNVHQIAPVAIRATVKSNPSWELSGSCSDGPNYQMPSVGSDGGLVTPQGMIESCTIKYHRVSGLVFKSEWSLLTTLEIRGDGKVELFPAEDGTIE